MLPAAPRNTIDRAEEMLKGEKKTFAALSSPSFLNRSRQKLVFALARGVGDAIVPTENGWQSANY